LSPQKTFPWRLQTMERKHFIEKKWNKNIIWNHEGMNFVVEKTFSDLIVELNISNTNNWKNFFEGLGEFSSKYQIRISLRRLEQLFRSFCRIEISSKWLVELFGESCRVEGGAPLLVEGPTSQLFRQLDEQRVLQRGSHHRQRRSHRFANQLWFENFKV